MKLPRFLSVSVWLGLVAAAATAVAADPLESGFRNPPDSAKPQTWWHWMNGNISKDGITADLEAMKDIGLGGATIVNADCGIPRGPVPFMSPEWREDFKFAVQEADRLGLKLCVENCAGWSSSGGPWNTVTNAMQKVTSSELKVTGPTNFTGTLPQPPVTLGYYREIAVLAFPVSNAEDLGMREYSPKVTVSGDEQPENKLTDGNSKTVVHLPLSTKTQKTYAQLEFTEAFSARTVRLMGGSGFPVCSGSIEVSDDGKTFRTVRPFSYTKRGAGVCSVSLGGQPVAARFWRVEFDELTAKARAKATTLPLAEIELAPRLTIGNVEAKAGFNGNFVLSSHESADTAEGAVQRRNVVDLTSKFSKDGQLNWTVPAGEWVILRMGYTPTGVNNHPAPKEGEGLECDKFSEAALDAHWDGFMQKVLDDIGPLAGKTLDSSLIDSYEVGGQNWSEKFPQEFKKRRGYDLLKYLPVFTGRVVDNPQVSERFLWDVRRTIADLFADNYFGHFAELCRKHGLLNAVEPYTGPFESLQSGAPADVVMGEFWSGSQGHPSVKLAASIAHIYGKTIVGAESFTAAPDQGRWLNDPYSLKTLGDLVYSQGLNRYIFHRYAMQPWTNHLPGMTMGQWGFHFERTETWWNQGKPWIDYISHCQFLLQQGRAVADAAYFTGESAPVEMRNGNPTLPMGYDYDAVNSDVLIHGATVRNGRITLASGASYAVLILPPEDVDISPATLQAIRKLVRSGATVVGPRPQNSPSLSGYPKCDARVKELADELWGDCDGKNILEHSAGKGRVVFGKSLADVFTVQGLKPDFEVQGASAKSRIVYTHRVDGQNEIYFVSNQRRQFDTVDCTFRTSGKEPELWNPETGVIEPAPVWSVKDGRITVRLSFEPAGSVFVIFRHAAEGVEHIVAADGKFEAIVNNLPELKILKAVYASVDGPEMKDVTSLVAEQAQSDRSGIEANNTAFGGDPAVNHVKELRVDYTYAGKTGHATARENETLLLPGGAVIGQAPQWELVNGGAGMPKAKVWGNGRVELNLADGKTLHAQADDVPVSQDVAGSWKLSFPNGLGAPPDITVDKLASWTENTDTSIRYFSGTAVYEKEIELSAEQIADGRELWLDLGAVKNFAEPSLNGKPMGVLWKPPFRVNITSAAKPGVNKLVVKVTNLWPNRLIGDEQLPPDREWEGLQLKEWPQWFLDGKPSPTGRLTFTTWHHWKKDSPLQESGLIGPVTLKTAEFIEWK